MRFHPHRPLLMLLVLAACARSESNDAPVADSAAVASAAPAAPAAPAIDPCTVITAEELKATADIEAKPQPSTSGGADVCSWVGANGGAVLQIYPYKSSYENSRTAFEDLYEGKSENVSGVGDQAFYIAGDIGATSTGNMSAVKGDKAISVQLLGGDKSKHRDRVVALTNLVLAKL